MLPKKEKDRFPSLIATSIISTQAFPNIKECFAKIGHPLTGRETYSDAFKFLYDNYNYFVKFEPFFGGAWTATVFKGGTKTPVYFDYCDWAPQGMVMKTPTPTKKVLGLAREALYIIFSSILLTTCDVIRGNLPKPEVYLYKEGDTIKREGVCIHCRFFDKTYDDYSKKYYYSCNRPYHRDDDIQWDVYHKGCRYFVDEKDPKRLEENVRCYVHNMVKNLLEEYITNQKNRLI